MTDDTPARSATTNRDYAVALGRAFAGAVIFGLPLLMTMEMWGLGHALSPLMLLQFSLANLVMLFGLSKVAGFEESHRSLDDVLDALAAYAVGVIVSVIGLNLVGVIGPDTHLAEAAGKIAIQAVPASFGAMIGARIMGDDQVEQGEQWRDAYSGQLFLFGAGALFLSFTIAPTEEVLLIAFQMTPWHALTLGVLSMLLLHVFVYSIGFSGQESRPEGGTFLSTFLHFTLAGYGVALLVSLYVLWSFGRTDGVSVAEMANMLVVLGFPASLGAATARLVV